MTRPSRPVLVNAAKPHRTALDHTQLFLRLMRFGAPRTFAFLGMVSEVRGRLIFVGSSTLQNAQPTNRQRILAPARSNEV
mmetsp:Transcript_12229/g.30853  ORF Transcript_12229/g.30853 Transcript_12229/m.30853 type:complete len:80 (-) Transcript_12229:272-511(-)